MAQAFDGRAGAGWRSVAWLAILSAFCGACGLWQTTSVEPVPVATPAARRLVQLSAAPAYQLVVPTSDGTPGTRLLVVNALVKNVGDVPFDFRPEAARLLLPDGSGGTVFDLPRAQEVLRRTKVAALAPPFGSAGGGWDVSYMSGEIMYLLLDATTLGPGQEAHGYVVADARTSVASLEGMGLEVSVTRSSDQGVERGSYRFVAPGGGGN
jgi:hypothetical protein